MQKIPKNVRKMAALVLCLTMMTAWQGGMISADTVTRKAPARTADGTYLIGTPEELAWFDYESTMVSEAKAVEMASANVRLTADIDMTGYEWLVISAKESSGYPTPGYKYFSGGSYRGTFDGAGHVIRGLKIERENTYIAYEPQNRIDCAGLFGYLHSAVIKDLGVEGTITILDRSESSYADYFHAGAIAGLVQKSVITGCFANMQISITNDPDNPGMTKCDNYVGGIAGGISGGSVIENCYSRGSVYSEGTRSVSAGGIVGATRNASKEYDSDGNYIVPNNNTVTKCWSDAAVRIEPDKMGCNTEPSYAGGIIGQVGATSDVVPIVSYCYALNPVLDGGMENPEGRSYAARVVGSGELFELSGMYNYGLDSMSIANAEISSYNAEDTGYHNIWGKDITAEQAKAPVDAYGYNVFTLNAWNYKGDTAEPENVWDFAEADSYPALVWQTHPSSVNPDPVEEPVPKNGVIEPGHVYLITTEDDGLALSSNNAVSSTNYRAAAAVSMEGGQPAETPDSSCLWTAEEGTKYPKLVNQGKYLYNDGSYLLASAEPAGNDEWMYAENEAGEGFLCGAGSEGFRAAYGIGYSTYGKCFEASYGNVHVYDVTPCRHENRDVLSRTEPSCEQDGTETFVCRDCGERITEVLPAAGHNYVNGVCTVCGKAEPQIITIGNAVSFSNMTPYYNAARYSAVQMIYTAEEVGGAGSIESVSFMPAQKTSSQTTENVSIYMGHRSSASFGSKTDGAAAEDLTLVYSGSPELGAGAVDEWETIPLDTPFAFNGKDNLIIAVTKGAGTGNSNLRYYYSNTADYTVLYRYGANSSYADLSGTAAYYQSKMRPYIQMTAVRGGQEDIVPGDLNGDGVTDRKDLLLVQTLALGLKEATPEWLAAADFNGDGRITASDVLHIRKLVTSANHAG